MLAALDPTERAPDAAVTLREGRYVIPVRSTARARIGGIVVLRVLVSETGTPIDVQVLKGVHGLTEAAVSAVRKWTFEPARRGGVPVQAWTTIPIPFQP